MRLTKRLPQLLLLGSRAARITLPLLQLPAIVVDASHGIAGLSSPASSARLNISSLLVLGRGKVVRLWITRISILWRQDTGSLGARLVIESARIIARLLGGREREHSRSRQGHHQQGRNGPHRY